jgi:hypothetical protein
MTFKQHYLGIKVTSINPTSKLSYDRPSVGQTFLVSSLHLGALCDQKTGLSLIITVGHRQRSHSRVQVPRDSYFSISDYRLPQPGRSGPRIYIPQEHGDPFILLGTGFSCRRLLRLAGLGRRCFNPPPRRDRLTHFF